LLGSAIGTIHSGDGQEVAAHDILSKCRNLPPGKKRKKCKAKGRAHRAWHAAHPTCPSSQYVAAYFANKTLDGEPVLARCEDWPIDHNWGSGSPGSRVPADGFSARWTGRSYIAEGEYDFIARGDDGIRVWMNDQLIIDRWSGALPEIRVGAFVPGGTYNVKVEFRELGGLARAFFRWDHVQGCGNNPPCTDGKVCVAGGCVGADEYRIVLTWGGQPQDLDSYLWTPEARPYKVYYNTPGFTDAFPYAFLDQDDQDGYGPETITIFQLVPGTYLYAVALYSRTGGTIGTAGAMVKVYRGGTLIRTFTPPASPLWTDWYGDYGWWKVFTMDGNGTITSINAPSGYPAPYVSREVPHGNQDEDKPPVITAPREDRQLVLHPLESGKRDESRRHTDHQNWHTKHRSRN
jgi:hypothetical protein